MALRAPLAFVALLLGGLNALLAWNGDTCTGNAPDSLFGYIITLPLNLLGMALLAVNPRPLPVIAACAIPALLAVPYTAGAFSLATGSAACALLTLDPHWELSGDETALALGWGASAAIFWLGLAYALSGGYRASHDRDADDFA